MPASITAYDLDDLLYLGHVLKAYEYNFHLGFDADYAAYHEGLSSVEPRPSLSHLSLQPGVARSEGSDWSDSIPE